MITWKRIEAGDYESEDGRFRILKSWDRIYSNHWKMYDKKADISNAQYHESTLLECKLKAEAICSLRRG